MFMWELVINSEIGNIVRYRIEDVAIILLTIKHR